MFIPHEVKEKIENLELEVKKLKAENQDLKNLDPVEPKKSSPVAAIVLGVLLVIAIFIIAYLFSFSTTSTVEDDNSAYIDSVSFYWDNQIVKLNTMPTEGVVYRVQIGAYEEYNLNNYKLNLDGLAQGSAEAFTKISLGGFSNILEAQAFQQEMARLGLVTAYIVAYKNEVAIGVLESEIEDINNDTIY